MLNARSKKSVLVAGCLMVCVMWGIFGRADGNCADSDRADSEQKSKSDAALERTREQIKMLDDIYKTAVVAITEKYVHKETDSPAIVIAAGLFETMKKKGWHEVRLIDATGTPYNEKNVATDEFDKSAIAALVGGQDYYEQVVTVEGKRHLRAATPVPVVMKKCTMCHANYENVKKGMPIGVLSYDVPLK